MSILIKGMEMPTCCYKCYLKQRNGMDIVCPVLSEQFSIADVNILYYRLDNCPLIPVPPHGDLIDRDALIINHTIDQYDWSEVIDVEDVRNAPTVIEAEEGE